MGLPCCSVADVLRACIPPLFSKLKDMFAQQRDLNDEINKISDKFESIKKTIEDPDLEEKQANNDNIRQWREKLKDLTYDIEDALDDCRVGGLAGDGGNSPGVIRRWMRPVLDLLPGETAALRRDMAQRLKSINERMVEIKKAEEDLVRSPQLLGGGMSQQQHETARRLETSFLPDRDRPMVGREEMKAKIKGEIILSYPTMEPTSSSSSHGGGRGASEKSRISIIAIVGVGGIGKTTLAQDIFNDQSISAKFPVRKWLYVGEKFDGKRLIKDNIRDGRNIHNLGDLQSKLIDEIRDKRFFIVLDDVWSEKSEEWDALWKPLSHGSKGGIVVVTTRSRRVAQTKRPVSEHLLKEMPDKECMEIFQRCAFEGVDMKEYPHLEELCEQIVQKLKGVPLAAKMMGGYLGRSLGDVHKWRSVINDAEWPLRYGEDLVDRVIGLSYYLLPPRLKPCFAYCSIFPKGKKFVKETVVQKWIAQGYIQAPGNQLEEHTGSEYFEDLHHRSFFHLNSSQYGDYYVMHDLVHDFARNVFSEGCQQGTIGSDCVASSKSMQVRYLSISCDHLGTDMIKELHKFKKIRTFHLDWLTLASPLNLFEEFRYIRVLELFGWVITEFPDSIRHLRFLRYLDIAESGIESLPELVCDLLNLQVLKVSNYCALPEGMSKLVNLRHLQANRKEITGIRGIGKLTCLQGLELFRVRNIQGEWGIQELKDLNHLHKELTICGLEKVTSKEEAELACLKDKVYLESLVLKWGKNANWSRDSQVPLALEWSHYDWTGEESMGVDSQVLEGLHPPLHLKSLMVKNNHEVRPPNWNLMVHSTLVKVGLRGCRHWECLPPLGRLPSLKELDIWEAHNVKKIGPEFYGVDDSNGGRGNKEFFPRLESLCFKGMGRWEEWGMPEDENDDRRVFPALKNLKIERCPRLASLSPILRHMTALEELGIRNCNELVSLEDGDGHGWVFPALKNLQIEECPRLVSLPPILRHMTALKKLGIRGCNELVSLEEGDGHGWVFPALKNLKIERCPRLASLSPILRHMTALEELGIRNCNELVSLEEGDRHGWAFPYLHSINIKSCPKLSTLSPILRHPTALRDLTISSCDELAMLGEGNGDGLWELSSLSALHVDCCPKLKSLSPLLPYFTSLKSLAITSCSTLWVPAITSIGSSSNRKRSTTWPLEKLSTDHRGLLAWILPDKFPSLKILVITGNDQLRSLAVQCFPEGGLPPSLQTLYISQCNLLRSLPSNLHSLGVLQVLYLRDCPAVQCFPEGGLPPSLQRLEIYRCNLLRSLPSNLHRLGVLGTLYLYDCPAVQCFPEGGLPPRLQKLSIYRCNLLQSLPSNLHSLGVLRELYLHDCPAVQCFPEGGLPPSLQILSINGCNLLRSLPEGGLPDSLCELRISGCPLLEERCREGGPDHPKIPTTTEVHFSDRDALCIIPDIMHAR